MIPKIQGILFLLSLPILIIMSIYCGVNDGNWALFMFLIIGIGIPILIIIISCEQSKSSYENASPEEKERIDYIREKRIEVDTKGYAITEESKRIKAYRSDPSKSKYTTYSTLTNEECWVDCYGEHARFFQVIRSKHDGSVIEVMINKWYEEKFKDEKVLKEHLALIKNLHGRMYSPKMSDALLGKRYG